MRTVLFSDLHLGLPDGGDIVRHRRFRDVLVGEVEGADQVVLLGDILELRARPLAGVLELARPLFEGLGEAIGDGRLVVVPGNHDYQLLGNLLERRRLQRRRRPLGLEQLAKPSSGPLASLARRSGGAEVALAYPGLWIRPDVYAIHGHYIDCHLTVPTFERLGVAAMERLVGGLPGGRRTPDDYERAQAPLYSFLYDLAQSGGRGTRYASANPSLRVWKAVGGGGGDANRDLRGWLLGSALVPGAVWAANRLGFGPLKADLSVEEIGRAGFRAMGEVVGRLGVDAEHVVYGHTHRRGPLPEERQWELRGGTRLHNTGSWIYAPALLGPTARGSGFWPGTVAVVEDAGPPRLRHLLDGLGHEELRRTSAPGPSIS